MIRSIAVALLTFASATAHAETDIEEAKRIAGELVTKGNQLFDARQYDQALAAFQEAYDTFPSPKIHYNLARTLAALDRTMPAIEHYQQFLSEAGLVPGDERRRKAEDELAKLESKIGRLAFETDAGGSRLTLDGEPQGDLPESTIHVLPGPHSVIIETPDGRRFAETVQVKAGETVRVHVLFPVVSAPPPDDKVVAETKPKKEPKEESGSVASKWWFWTAIAAGLVAVGTGVGVGVASSRGSGEFVRDGELDVSSTADWERR